MTFLTSYRREDGRKWCGPDIEAADWDDAEAKAAKIGIPGLVVLGKLVESIEVNTLHVGQA